MSAKRAVAVLGAVVVAAVASLVAWAAGLALAMSWWAIGFETGWWPGDSNLNDGEGGSALAVGLVLLVVAVVGAVGGIHGCLAAARVPGRRALVIGGAAAVLLVATASTVLFIVG